MGKEFAQPHQS